MGHQGEGYALGEQGERSGEAGEGVGAKACWFHGFPDWAPVERRLPGSGAKKTGGDGTELSAERPAVCGEGINPLATGGQLRDESPGVNFHSRCFAMSVSDKFYLCAKITFSGFEDSSSK
jgi:hypothetical protein